jgi:hypothetical protein
MSFIGITLAVFAGIFLWKLLEGAIELHEQDKAERAKTKAQADALDRELEEYKRRNPRLTTVPMTYPHIYSYGKNTEKNTLSKTKDPHNSRRLVSKTFEPVENWRYSGSLVVIPIRVRSLSFVRRVVYTDVATPQLGTASNDQDHLELEHAMRRAG